MSTLLEKFCRYVKVETTADELSSTYPSSEGQRELAGLLMQELKELGLEASVSEHAIVSALLPGTVEGAPTICWLAHMDTSPAASGKNVSPQVVKRYSGGDLPLLNGRAIPAADLVGFEGKTLVTTDGETLLGADDKAGVAVIMTALERLLDEPEFPRCPVRVIFTCDEEIGRGTDKLDLGAIGAVCAYTVDGESEGHLENETFSADLALIRIRGVSIHPGLAYGKLCNAVRAAGHFLQELPPKLTPECTQGREPFLHPYTIEGDVAEVRLRIILRSFETRDLEDFAESVRDAAERTMEALPGIRIDVEVKAQYRNMLEYLAKEPRAVTLAQEAYRRAGITPQLRSVRGGTDGSRLSELGLPTPNIFAGMHNFHGELEFACLDEMESSVRVLMELAGLWSEQR